MCRVACGQAPELFQAVDRLLDRIAGGRWPDGKDPYTASALLARDKGSDAMQAGIAPNLTTAVAFATDDAAWVALGMAASDPVCPTRFEQREDHPLSMARGQDWCKQSTVLIPVEVCFGAKAASLIP